MLTISNKNGLYVQTWNGYVCLRHLVVCHTECLQRRYPVAVFELVTDENHDIPGDLPISIVI